MPAPLRIGVSACFFHADPERKIFRGKTLLYAEESMLRWILHAGALPILLPRAAGPFSAPELIAAVDGLVLQGGSDMSPKHYGEEPARPEWEGDFARDVYEMELVRTAMELDRPVLGVCRGLQVINVALGGSLWQDIQTMHPQGVVHRDWHIYDQLFHTISIDEHSWLAHVYTGARSGKVNSVHHQGVRDLARGLVPEATATADNMVEAVRYVEGDGDAPFVAAVQWHPEFLDERDSTVLDPQVLARAFLDEVRRRRHAAGA